jgi:hypothetical protein
MRSECPVSARCADQRERPKCMYRLLFANRFWHILGSCSYVFGLLIDTRVVALLGLSTYAFRVLRLGSYVFELLPPKQVLGAIPRKPMRVMSF